MYTENNCTVCYIIRKMVIKYIEYKNKAKIYSNKNAHTSVILSKMRGKRDAAERKGTKAQRGGRKGL
jgi:hypothetical protein